MPAAESVIPCPSCTNAMIIATYSTFCPSCQYVIPGDGIQVTNTPAAPGMGTALGTFLPAADAQEIPCDIAPAPSTVRAEQQKALLAEILNLAFELIKYGSFYPETDYLPQVRLVDAERLQRMELLLNQYSDANYDLKDIPMPAAESVINCPICNNAMIFEGKGGGYCPSCQPPAPSTALDDLVAAADEIAYQYQPLRFYGWPALAVIEEQWLEKLDAALEAWRASPESTV